MSNPKNPIARAGGDGGLRKGGLIGLQQPEHAFGYSRDTKTGRPPKLRQDYLDRLKAEREERAIARLMGRPD